MARGRKLKNMFTRAFLLVTCCVGKRGNAVAPDVPTPPSGSASSRTELFLVESERQKLRNNGDNWAQAVEPSTGETLKETKVETLEVTDVSEEEVESVASVELQTKISEFVDNELQRVVSTQDPLQDSSTGPVAVSAIELGVLEEWDGPLCQNWSGCRVGSQEGFLGNVFPEGNQSNGI